MAKRLTRLQVDEVSVVDKAANGKRFLILKRAREALSKKAAGRSGPTTEVDEMTAEEIKKAITDGAADALAPILERIERLERALTAKDDEAPDPVEKADDQADDQPTGPTAEEIGKMVTDGVTAAVKPLADRIEKLESIEGVRQSGLDEGGAHQVTKSVGSIWEGSGLLL